MWAVHPRQSYETPKAWMKNASDLNSVIKKRERERTKLLQGQGYVWKTTLTENCGNKASVWKKGLYFR